MSDDCYLDNYVNLEKKTECLDILRQRKYATIQLELSWSSKDIDSEYDGFKIRRKFSTYRLSLLCGIWKKQL